MPQPTNSLLEIVNPQQAKELGAGPLLSAWAMRTKNGLDSSPRQIEALATVDESSPFYQALGGDVMRNWVKAVLSEAPVFIDVLGLPYGGPNDGKDNDGNWFSAQTDFMDGVIDSPPVLYGHGAMNGVDADIHGKVHARWYAKDGGWFKVELKRDSPRFEQLYDAHVKGYLRASSGAVPATVEIAPSGHVDRWLVGELTLVDLRDGYRPSNGYAITKATVIDDTTLFNDYYGEPVLESNLSIWEWINQKLVQLRQEIANRVMSNNGDDMAKCEKCDEVAAEEAEKLRTELIALKAEQDAKPKECLPCRAAIQWVGQMVKASKLSIPEAMELVDKYEVDATGWEMFKDEVEARDTTVRQAVAKAQKEGKEISIVTGNRGDNPNTVDPEYMNRMRASVGLEKK